MNELLARHLADAVAALRRVLEAEVGDVPALPVVPRPAAVVPRAPAPVARPAPVAPPPPRPLPTERPAPIAQRPAPPPPARPDRPGATPQRPQSPGMTQYGTPFPSASPDLPEALEPLQETIATCTRCPLHQSRTLPVFGEGRRQAPTVMFVGDVPGAEEDLAGRPFVGPAGQLLDKMIVAMGLRREDCYVTNVLKCRTPDDAKPLAGQVEACLPFLQAQIRLLQPRFLVALGPVAGRALTGQPEGVARLRGRMLRHGDIPLVVTYHPAALLQDPAHKKPTWEDLQLVMARLREG